MLQDELASLSTYLSINSGSNNKTFVEHIPTSMRQCTEYFYVSPSYQSMLRCSSLDVIKFINSTNMNKHKTYFPLKDKQNITHTIHI